MSSHGSSNSNVRNKNSKEIQYQIKDGEDFNVTSDMSVVDGGPSHQVVRDGIRPDLIIVRRDMKLVNNEINI